MKKRTILSGFILLFSACLFPQSAQDSTTQENPLKANMDSFMGMKWGDSAANFFQSFKYRDQMKKMISKVPNLLAYRIKDFKLYDGLEVKIIDFYWSAYGKKHISTKKKNFDKYFLEEVEIFISATQFDRLFAEFKSEYGEPDRYAEFNVKDNSGTIHQQKKAMWINTTLNRKIYMDKMHDSIDEGFVKFQRYHSSGHR
jgi:hypothetical protein